MHPNINVEVLETQEIAKNQYYELKVDKEKNRLYFKVYGFWANTVIVPNYLTDIRSAASELSKGFVVISDLKDMKTPPPDVGFIHEQAQRILLEAGLKKTAEILNDVILQMAVNRYSIHSKMPKQCFASFEEAEKWLRS